jgi:hypothetical protein
MNPTGRCSKLKSPTLILHFSPQVGHSNIGPLMPMVTSFAVKRELLLRLPADSPMKCYRGTTSIWCIPGI